MNRVKRNDLLDTHGKPMVLLLVLIFGVGIWLGVTSGPAAVALYEQETPGSNFLLRVSGHTSGSLFNIKQEKPPLTQATPSGQTAPTTLQHLKIGSGVPAATRDSSTLLASAFDASNHARLLAELNHLELPASPASLENSGTPRPTSDPPSFHRTIAASAIPAPPSPSSLESRAKLAVESAANKQSARDDGALPTVYSARSIGPSSNDPNGCEFAGPLAGFFLSECSPPPHQGLPSNPSLSSPFFPSFLASSGCVAFSELESALGACAEAPQCGGVVRTQAQAVATQPGRAVEFELRRGYDLRPSTPAFSPGSLGEGVAEQKLESSYVRLCPGGPGGDYMSLRVPQMKRALLTAGAAAGGGRRKEEGVQMLTRVVRTDHHDQQQQQQQPNRQEEEKPRQLQEQQPQRLRRGAFEGPPERRKFDHFFALPDAPLPPPPPPPPSVVDPGIGGNSAGPRYELVDASEAVPEMEFVVTPPPTKERERRGRSSGSGGEGAAGLSPEEAHARALRVLAAEEKWAHVLRERAARRVVAGSGSGGSGGGSDIAGGAGGGGGGGQARHSLAWAQALVRSAPPSWVEMLAEDQHFADVARETLEGAQASAAGPLEEYLVGRGGKLPVAVLTANRPEMLEQTLNHWMANVRGARKEDVFIFQDGTDAAVASAARSLGFEPIQHVQHLRATGDLSRDGAAHIAQHYKFALQSAFAARPEAPAVIVVEDDFLFSPDFLEYFEQVGPLLERDPTAFVLSAWNDNGLKGKVEDTSALCRTGFFPGLGWMLTRELWEKELERRWPAEHWDHWMREPQQHKGREAVYPEVNRDYHAGQKGTFMDDYHHNRYFRDIAYNTDASTTVAPWTRRHHPLPPLASSSSSSSYSSFASRGLGAGVVDGGSGGGAGQAEEEEEEEQVWVPAWLFGASPLYEARIEAVLRSGQKTNKNLEEGHGEEGSGGGEVSGGGDTATLSAEEEALIEARGTRHVRDLVDLAEVDEYSHVVLWHDTDFTRLSDVKPPFKPMADYFNIWHEWMRTAHAGSLHHFRWGARGRTELFLVNVQDFVDGHRHESRYAKFKPRDAKLFDSRSFEGQSSPLPKSLLVSLRLGASSEAGMSCDQVCAALPFAGGVPYLVHREPDSARPSQPSSQALEDERNGGAGSSPSSSPVGDLFYVCEPKAFSAINDCDQMRRALPCEACTESFGFEQPAYVVGAAPPENFPKQCLYSSKPAESTCAAKHHLTKRLCPCVPKLAPRQHPHPAS